MESEARASSALSDAGDSSPKRKLTNSELEMRAMKAKLRGMDLILMQNAALEREVERLCAELDEATSGVQKKGYLYKYREREIYYASKWGLRYVVLQGNKLSYFGDEHDRRPRRTFDLSNCYVRDEGKVRGGYHVFSVYLSHDVVEGEEDDDHGNDSLLLRVSTENGADAAMWISMLEKGCAMSDEAFPEKSPMPSMPSMQGFATSHHDLAAATAGFRTDYGHAGDPLFEATLGLTPIADSPVDTTSPDSAVFQETKTTAMLSKEGAVGAGVGMGVPPHTTVPCLAEEDDWGHSKILDSRSTPDFSSYGINPHHTNSDAISIGGPGGVGSDVVGDKHTGVTTGENDDGDGDDDDSPDFLPPAMLQRVLSASKVLQRSISRSTIAKQILAHRMPHYLRPSAEPTNTSGASGADEDGSQNYISDDGVSPSDAADSDISSIKEKIPATSMTNNLRQRSRQQKPATSATTNTTTTTTTDAKLHPSAVRDRKTALAAAAAKGKSGPQKVSGHKRFPAYKPMHVQTQSSPLSNDTDNRVHSFRGFFNLAVIILVLSHIDLMINNINKYGLKVSIPMLLWNSEPVQNIKDELLESAPYLWYICLAMFTWVGSVLMAYTVETAAYWGRYPERFVHAVNVTFGAINIVLPTVLVWYSKAHPGLNMIYLFQSSIIWMKLISYAHVNKDLRKLHRKLKKADRDSSKTASSGNLVDNSSRSSSRGDLSLMPPPVMVPLSRTTSLDSNASNTQTPPSLDINAKPFSRDPVQAMLAEVQDLEPPFLLYPMNLTLQNLLYFMVAPTLCYQLNYPRSKAVRWSHVLSLTFRMLIVAALMVFAAKQYIYPTLETSVAPMHAVNIPLILERLLKLSIPNTYIWLLGFYFYFHLWLNLLAEVTRFGDRQFYKEWWNARTIDSYWRNWNMPVHHWATRHLYYPLLRMKVPKMAATFVVFFFSAAMHELIISVPFRYIAMHAFMGMMLQAPMITVTKMIDKRFDNAFIGNAIFWCMFCIFGQPMGIIMYHYDLWKISSAGIAATAATAAAAG